MTDLESLGRTEPNTEGHTYRHGTMTAYSLGRCRCDYCRGAYATYRDRRRSEAKDNPTRPRSLDTDGHIPGHWFRDSVWRPAIAAAGLEIQVRLHDLRHVHASWLQMSGVAAAASFDGTGQRAPPALQRAAPRATSEQRKPALHA